MPLLFFSGCSGEPKMPKNEERAITISGSASAYPTLQALAAAYEKEYPDDSILFLPPVHSKGGITGCADGTSDLGLITRLPTMAEEQYRLLNFPVARDLLVFATHPQTNVHDITVSELFKIYSGSITNWQALGGIDQEIVVLDRPANTSAKKALLDYMKGKGFSVTPKAMVLERPSQMNEALQRIPGSIGYSSYGDLQSLKLPPLALYQDGKKLLMNDYRATHLYPSRQYTLLSKDRPKGLAKDFIAFIYSATGQETIRSLGHIPKFRQVNLALIPEVDIMKQELRYRGLLNYLSHKVGLPFNIRFSPSYTKLVQDFSSHDFDAAFLGSFSYVLVNSMIPMQVLARPQIEGNAFYKGILFVRKDSGISTAEDMRNRSLCLVDKTTSAGYLFPLQYFKQQQIGKAEEFFKKITYAGTHETVIRNVLKGRDDVGAAKNLIYLKMAKIEPRVAKELVVLATSPGMPTNGLAVRKNLDWDIKEDLQKILMHMHDDPAGKPILKQLGAEKFLSTRDEDYKNVYAMLDYLGINPKQFLCTLEHRSNTHDKKFEEGLLP